MGAECVRLSPKLHAQSNYHRHAEPYKMRGSEEILSFELIISDLELQCTANNVGKVIFSVDQCFTLSFGCDQFFLMDKMIRCSSQKRASFVVSSKQLQFLEFWVSILDTRGAKIERVCLKLHAVCEGPKHHDHLLKEMKARIIYNLEVSQLVNAAFGCADYKIHDQNRNNVSNEFCLSLDMILPNKDTQDGEDSKKIIFSTNPEQSQKFFKNNIPSKLLKQSLFRVMLYKINLSGFPESQVPEHQICIPYMKFWGQDDTSMISQKEGTYEKVDLKYSERIKESTGQFLEIYLQLNLKTTKVYLQQIQCLIFSQNGLKTVSPWLLNPKMKQITNNCLSAKVLQPYEKLFKKQKKVTYQTKNQIQKSIKQCYSDIFQKDKMKVCNMNQLEFVQNDLLNILNSLSQLLTQGQDVTNQSIWLLIDAIIHRPQLSTNYLYLIENPVQKTQIGLKYYGFIFAMLSKIILCTTMGLTYHELKCIQKFVGYVYFRCKWIQDLVVKALQKKDDPQFTAQKLMQIGVYFSNKSPSKSLVYDWEQCLLPHIKNDPMYREISNNLLQTSESVPKWAELLFNREDDDLYYGLIIQIWGQAEQFLNNQGRIMWEYFPYYAELLSTFLGEMNNNKIMDYSNQFRECSMKLISNQKLLNNFVMFLFPKTCLYQTYCVIKCLELIHSYFEAISSQNKKMPNEFNFNYFYTGIRCIFQSNHSYLLIRVIALLYDYYHIFSNDFKRSLDSFILSKGFNQIFLHWCGYVRKMFYLFLEFRIAVKYREHENANSKSILSFDGIERMHQYKNLIENIEKQDEKCRNTKIAPARGLKDTYHLKMKQKLQQKKLKKKVEPRTPPKLSMATSFNFQNEGSLTRKNTQWISTQTQLNKNSRRWSVDLEQEYFSFVAEGLVKYVEAAMKQYRETLKIENPDQQVKKIMKIFNSNKSVDN